MNPAIILAITLSPWTSIGLLYAIEKLVARHHVEVAIAFLVIALLTAVLWLMLSILAVVGFGMPVSELLLLPVLAGFVVFSVVAITRALIDQDIWTFGLSGLGLAVALPYWVGVVVTASKRKYG